MSERAQVVHAIPAEAAQLFWGLAGGYGIRGQIRGQAGSPW
ncbi:hypothetical protein BSU04_15900 [Caballeronia sordidicola]|uniref:Uncharacterized protein n=1 Tax=Caballeronia sordidicola TaxID=196367 RepID=A0A226X2N9_CABSO|nr:hypothetical protein BSU04_15900 [Caballeronia sordidicola]